MTRKSPISIMLLPHQIHPREIKSVEEFMKVFLTAELYSVSQDQ
jgi:hypothetical protein